MPPGARSLLPGLTPSGGSGGGPRRRRLGHRPGRRALGSHPLGRNPDEVAAVARDVHGDELVGPRVPREELPVLPAALRLFTWLHERQVKVGPPMLLVEDDRIAPAHAVDDQLLLLVRRVLHG